MNGRRRAAAGALAALTLSLAACEDPLGTRNDRVQPGDHVTLPILGHGTVTERFTAEVAARGQWAYTTTWRQRTATGNAIKIWNVADSVPLLVDSVIVSNTFTLGDVQISDDGSLLVVATELTGPGSIIIYDRTDPAQLVQLSRFTSASTAPGVHTVKLGRVDGRLYAFLSINPDPARLVVLDLSDPAQPVELLSRPMGRPFVHDVFVRDGLLFTALWHDGLSIWDIGGGGQGGSPSNPVLLGNVETADGSAHNVWWYHASDGSKRYAFVGEEAPGVSGAASAGDIHVVDVSDMTAPREVAFFTVPNAGVHNFTMDETNGFLYAAYYNGGVRVLDVRGDLTSCSSAQRAADGRCDLGMMGREVGVGLGDLAVYVWGVALAGARLFASDMLSGLYVLDTAPLFGAAAASR
jgi:hypothetical protein